VFYVQLMFGASKPASSSVVNLKKPALFLHGTSKVDTDALERLILHKCTAERLQRTFVKTGILGDVSVCYFRSESDALLAQEEIKKSDHKIRTTYR
jgi:hypothetical protein